MTDCHYADRLAVGVREKENHILQRLGDRMFKYAIILLCGLGVFLPIGARSESYDRSLEVTAPGEWMLLTGKGFPGRFRFNTRCYRGEICWNMGRSTLASVRAPEGWEIKWGAPVATGVDHGTQTVLHGTAVSGGVIMLRCAANSVSNQNGKGTYACSRELLARRLSTTAGNGTDIVVKMDFQAEAVQTIWSGFKYRNGVWESGSVEGIRNEPEYQPKIARLDYSSSVRFTKGEQVNFLKITASTSTARLQVNILGAGANVLTLGNSDTGAKGAQACDGTIRTGMTCFVTTKDNMEWYGEKQAIARITLSVT